MLNNQRVVKNPPIMIANNFSKVSNKMQQNDNLFEQIRDHLQEQAKNGERIDTETELAKRFGVTRYRIRKELDILTQMGILVRTPKRGTTVREVGANSLRNQIQMRFDVANFDVQEFIEARALVECSLMPLVSRRITPALASRLEVRSIRLKSTPMNRWWPINLTENSICCFWKAAETECFRFSQACW